MRTGRKRIVKKIKDFKGTVTISGEYIERLNEQAIFALAEGELDAFCENFKRELLKYWLLTRPLVKNKTSKKRFWQTR